MKTHWTKLQTEMYDSDGNHPDDRHFLAAVAEFRRTGCIQGYWFCDISGIQGHVLTVWDPWQQKNLSPDDAGPDVTDIDWTGFPE